MNRSVGQLQSRPNASREHTLDSLTFQNRTPGPRHLLLRLSTSGALSARNRGGSQFTETYALLAGAFRIQPVVRLYVAKQPSPTLSTIEDMSLIGTTAIYDSQAEASERIPHQWREFRLSHPMLGSSAEFYGASPCTDDRKIHYLTGVARDGRDGSITGERLTLKAGEYAVVRVDDASLLRDTWIWLLKSWLPKSGRREERARV